MDFGIFAGEAMATVVSLEVEDDEAFAVLWALLHEESTAQEQEQEVDIYTWSATVEVEPEAEAAAADEWELDTVL